MDTPPPSDRLARRDMLVAGLGLVLGVPVSGAAGAEAVKPYLGSFHWVGGDKEREARDKAIDDVVSGMNLLARDVARSKLKSANPIPKRLVLTADAKSLTVDNGLRAYTGPLDGSKVKVRSMSDDELEMRFDITKESLTQTFEGEGKGRVNLYTLSGDRGLGWKVRVYAEQLPKDLVYRLSYERD